MELPSEEDFRNFFMVKTFDVIGQGTFKRHLCKCKEAGDVWATNMSQGVAKMQGLIKSLHVRIASIPKPRNTSLQQLCRDVMGSAQPPIRMFAGYTNCSISGEHCNTCIDLTRPSKGNTGHVHIHARFSHFFLMLWFTSKLEYIVRSCAKAWLDRQDQRDEANFRELCEAFTKESEDFWKKLYKVFCISLEHVNRSLDHLFEMSVDRRVLKEQPA